MTPTEWDCLDGTLYVDEKGPWMIFCHEWVQVSDGTVCAIQLSSDLKDAITKPVELFKASCTPWVELLEIKNAGLYGYVTDGPFLYRTSNQLLMIWSSFRNHKYALGVARSITGNILGPWIHDTQPLFSEDGGHGMLFRTFAGQLMLSIHSPNNTPNERPVFLEISEIDGKLKLK
jgi:hypothetical protein